MTEMDATTAVAAAAVTTAATMSTTTDVIVVGSGLAGLVVALRLLEQAQTQQTPTIHVTILEKEAKFGMGNSMKASSGINGATQDDNNNSNSKEQAALASFRHDTLTSAGSRARPHLIEPLVQHSHEALEWLRDTHGVDLSQTTQLGGHSASRTHRPANGTPIGAAIMTQLQKAVIRYAANENEKASGDNEQNKDRKNARVTILTHCKATQLLWSAEEGTHGVEYVDTSDENNNDDDAPTKHRLNARHGVVLATGGYSASAEVVARYRPDLVHFATTQGPFSTGDGLNLALALPNVVNVVDLDQIQVHPTGFVDPKHPDSKHLFLAAEVLRGIGGILLSENEGRRFCNELGRRDDVTEQMLQLVDPDYDKTKANWNPDKRIPQVYLVLTAQAGDQHAAKHVGFYSFKGLLQKVQGLAGLAQFMGGNGGGSVSKEQLRTTLRDYQAAARDGRDAFGKTRFPGVPTLEDDEWYYVGKVTPVLHYCMGGVAIDPHGRVLLRQQEEEEGSGKEDCKEEEETTAKEVVRGLYACGEAAGGLHGDNRLAGNSLLDCVVFGSIVSQSIVEDADSSSRK